MSSWFGRWFPLSLLVRDVELLYVHFRHWIEEEYALTQSTHNAQRYHHISGQHATTMRCYHFWGDTFISSSLLTVYLLHIVNLSSPGRQSVELQTNRGFGWWCWCPAHKTTHRVSYYKFPSFSIHKLASKCMWRWAHVFTTGTFLCVTFPSFNAPASTCLLYRRRRRRRRRKSF